MKSGSWLDTVFQICRRENMNKKKGMILVMSAAIMLIIGAVYIYKGSETVDVTTYQIKSEKINDGIRIALLTDLHSTEIDDGNKKLIQQIKDSKPDIICYSGDMINWSDTNYEVTLELTKNLVEIAPVYYGLGNHEYYKYVKKNRDFMDMFQKAGATMLNNTYETIEIKGNTIDIGCICEAPEQYEKYKPDIVDRMEQSEHFKLLLAHVPELYMGTLNEKDIDLSLAGHAHGGQIRIPYIGGLYSPDQGFLPKLTAGVHEYNKTTLIISRGLGDHTFVPRINNNPELVIIDISQEKENQ